MIYPAKYARGYIVQARGHCVYNKIISRWSFFDHEWIRLWFPWSDGSIQNGR